MADDIPLFLQDDDASFISGGGGGDGGGWNTEPTTITTTVASFSSRSAAVPAFLSALDCNTGGNAAVSAAPAAIQALAANAPTADAAAGQPLVLSSAEELYFVAPAHRCFHNNRSNPKGAAAADCLHGCAVVYNLKREGILGKGNFGCATLYRNVAEHNETSSGVVAKTKSNARSVVVKDINLQAMVAEREGEVAALMNEVTLLLAVKGHANCLFIFGYFSSLTSASNTTNTTTDSSSSSSKGGHASAAALAAFREVLLDKTTKFAYLLTEFCPGGDLAMRIESAVANNSINTAATATTSTSTLPSSLPPMVFVNEANPRYLSETFVASVLIQLLVGLEFLHSEKKIIHRDIKPQNLFFRDDGISMRIGDFGIAVCEAHGSANYSSAQFAVPKKTSSTSTGGGRPASSTPSTNNHNHRKEVKGTPFYMAPELFLEVGRHSYAVDVWSAGVLLYECIALEKPFIASSYQGLSQAVTSGRCVPLRERSELRRNSSSSRSGGGGGGVQPRPSSSLSLSSPDEKRIYTKDLLEIVMSMLTVDPAMRPSVARLLRKGYVRRQLHAVPRAVLDTAHYRSIFGADVIDGLLSLSTSGGSGGGGVLFPGVPPVEDEMGSLMPPVATAATAAAPNEAAMRTAAVATAAAAVVNDDDGDEYEDDFESD